MYLMPLTLSLALLSLGGLCLSSAFALFHSARVDIWSWSMVIKDSSELEFCLVMDPVSLSFLGSVAVIASAVLVFSCSYMAAEKFFIRFHLLVLSFVGAMAMLILSPNLISLMLGWDGLGVTSFLLVVYFHSAKASNAGMLTVLTNRLGDLFLILAIAFQLSEGSWSLFNPSMAPDFRSSYGVLLLVCLAAFTKSAQVPFSAWLPAAMAAPTPVSSLVHSSTLVTAGVYLLIRTTLVLEYFNLTTPVLAAGALTMLMAGVSALMEPDMKKVVALSTLSQLGLMMSALGLGMWEVAFLHLLTHAYFKALLFMAVGNMIHLSDDYQDSRKASLSSFSAVSLGFSGVANLSLCGLPFTSGFFTKDAILEFSLVSYTNFTLTVVFFLATALTASYSVRLTLVCWWSVSRKSSLTWESDKDVLVYSCCAILWPLAIASGYSLTSAGSPLNGCLPLSLHMKNMTLGVITLGALLGYTLSRHSSLSHIRLINWSWGSMWALPNFSSSWVANPSLAAASWARVIDLSWMSSAPIWFFVGKSVVPHVSAHWAKFLSFIGVNLVMALALVAVFCYGVALKA